ncbi:MAG: hypothetical protein JSR48_08710, partial [Verrucomicrobia bacterium]|nr:hypothetical protein [Verrucomicrobiota bacterium]
LARQDFDEFLRLGREVPGVNDSGGAMVTGATRAAMVMAFRGDHAAAANRLKVFIEQTQARLKLDPTNIHLLRHAALACAAVGRKEEARAYADQAVAARPESKDARAGAYSCVVRAIVLAWTGDKDQAIAELARLLRKPGMLWVPVMKWEPSYYPLHGDPRFEALLNDPKNNAPLF